LRFGYRLLFRSIHFHSSVAGAGVDLAAVHSRWDKFELMLESHSLMIKEQIDVMKGGVESRKDALILSVQKFASRWEALKPKEAALENSALALAAIGMSVSRSIDMLTSIAATIKEKRIEFDEMVKNAETIKADCDHFGLPEPNLNEVEPFPSHSSNLTMH
jgi:dynein heavy chain 2